MYLITLIYSKYNNSTTERGRHENFTAGFFNSDIQLEVSAGRLLVDLMQLVIMRHNLDSK